METFLEKAASHIFHKHSIHQLSSICIVIPSRRGVLYFKQALANQADAPFLAPDVMAIDDFVMNVTGLKQIDPVALLFELYDIFKTIDPLVVFERFMTWAPTLLNDFDKIDQYLVDPKKLFSFMSEAKALERWQMQLGESQRDRLKSTERTDRYFKLFENIHEVYNLLQARLREKGLVYRGMAYRELAEHIDTYLLDTPQHKKYYFVGFNALSNAEEKIIRSLLKRKEGNDFFAETLWDSDAYYLSNKDQKAGNWLRDYRTGNNMPDELPLFNNEWNWVSNELLKGQKNVQIIGVANASMQAKVAGKIYADWNQQIEGQTQTAIVLGDENLLVPVMNSLGKDVANLNITMGLSLKNSMLFTLIDAMFEMQRNLVEFKNAEGETKRIPKFSYRQVVRILNHPFVRRYEAMHYPLVEEQTENEPLQNPIRQTLRDITVHNKVFLSSKELKEMGQDDRLFNIVFNHWEQKPKKAVEQFYALIDLLREVYRERQDAVENEYLYQFYLLLQRMEMILAERGESVSIKSFKTFLYELIKQTKIPFESETDQRLQIMGMLETRTLDFERLIILSVNEGVLPQGKRQNTLIPYEALSDPQFNLPTHNHADAVMAYHFFRLLQRAKEVVLVHVLPSDTYGAAEKSRFILQIEHELRHLNPNLNITQNQVNFETEITADEEESGLKIEKTPDMLAMIEQEINERGIYPSHVNQFVDCSMQYYFNKVAGIAPEEEVAEKLASDSFGNWIHKTFENIDTAFLQGDDIIEKTDGIIQQSDLEFVLKNIDTYLKKAFEQTNPGLRMTEGENYILYQVGETLVKKFLKFQIANEVFPIELLDAEKTLKVGLEVEVNGRTIPFKLAGRIDRIDRIHGRTVRVIDYKTGLVKPEDLKVKTDLIDEILLEESDKGKLRQLWLYKYMILKRMTTQYGLSIRGTRLKADDNKVVSGIYSFRNIEAGLLEQDFKFSDDETIEEFMISSEKYLAKFLEKLLNPEVPFSRTEDRDICTYCDFKRICGR